MSAAELNSLLPYFILTAGALLLMLIITVRRNHEVSNIFTLLVLLVSTSSVFWIGDLIPTKVGSLFIVDHFARFYTGLVLVSSIAVTLISHRYLVGIQEYKEEYYMLLLIGTLGAALLTAANHFISLFLGLEVLTVSLYGMIAYLRQKDWGLEAGLKYLILAAVSSAFLLFGMALIYAKEGTMTFSGISAQLSAINILDAPLLLIGFGMMVVGIGFKLAVVPFHMWTPDVYQGSPAPVAAFIATVSKGGMFAVVLRFIVAMEGTSYDPFILVFSVIAIASMFAGNLLALLQDNVKRILAYSSIAHFGYLLIAFIASGELAVEAATFYLLAYFITILGAFGIVSVMSSPDKEAQDIDDYAGLFWRQPLLSVAFTAMMLSLAGIPLTAGFIGKYYLITAGVQSELWVLLLILAVNSVIGLYYYLRIVATMFRESPEEAPRPVHSLGNGVALTVLTILLVFFGVYPTQIISFLQVMAGSLY